MSTIVSFNPAAPDEEVARAVETPRDAVCDMAATAAQAQRTWRSLPPARRGEALAALANAVAADSVRLAHLICCEVAKPISEARAEVQRSIDILRYYAGLTMLADGETLPAGSGRGWIVARRHPVGVVGLITPWNFPLAIPVWKAAPALAFGNAVVLKPAPEAIGVAQWLARAAADVLPAGLLALVAGGRSTAEALISAPPVSAISFTGSTSVGRQVASMAAARGIAAQCEMGGQNAAVVLADADLDLAADCITSAITGYAGQKCTAVSRVIAEKPIAAALREALTRRLASLTVGHPLDPRSDVGPLISADALVRVSEVLGRSRGTPLIEMPDLSALPGHYMAPVLVAVDAPDDVLAREEVFGPVAAFLEARSSEDALALANDGDYGLVAGIYTRDLGAAMTFCDALEVGMVKVNAPTTGADFHAPFGGARASSLGPHEQGLAAREFFTKTRTLTLA